MRGPNANDFVFRWNIGFKLLEMGHSRLSKGDVSKTLKSGNGESKQCRNLSPHDMNKLYTKFHVFLPSHFEAS